MVGTCYDNARASETLMGGGAGVGGWQQRCSILCDNSNCMCCFVTISLTLLECRTAIFLVRCSLRSGEESNTHLTRRKER